MRWVAKALLQKAVSALPRPEAANYVLQRHVTRSLPISDAAFLRKATLAARHAEAFEEHAEEPLSRATFYEFGAGWDLVIPIVYWALGVERQILVDIRPNLRFELIRDALAKLERQSEALAETTRLPLRSPGGASVESAADLEREFGIRYLAPSDARDTGLPEASVDFVSSTDTLEHIPRDDIAAILRECRRLLRPSGLVSFRIDLRDHYADFDPKISVYNFLCYGDRLWSLADSAVHYQNRLRAPDHLRLIEDAGFTVLEKGLNEPTAGDLEALARLPLAPRFGTGYTPEELGAKSLRVVARPASGF